jgi:DNA-binding transcriptional regulator YdaS (Cro superfamily)
MTTASTDRSRVCSANSSAVRLGLKGTTVAQSMMPRRATAISGPPE